MAACLEEMLGQVLSDYRAGKVSQSKAAKALKIRKARFVELANTSDVTRCHAAIEQIERLVEPAVRMQDYRRRFNGSFPECDVRNVRQENRPGLSLDPMFRCHPPAPVRVYEGDEAARIVAEMKSGTNEDSTC